jgi:hypothetical protein
MGLPHFQGWFEVAGPESHALGSGIARFGERISGGRYITENEPKAHTLQGWDEGVCPGTLVSFRKGPLFENSTWPVPARNLAMDAIKSLAG